MKASGRRRVAVIFVCALVMVAAACAGTQPVVGGPAGTAPASAASGATTPAKVGTSVAPGTGLSDAPSGGTVPPASARVPVKSAVEPKGTVVDGTLKTPDGRERTYHVYVPSHLPEASPVPLLLALHGGTGWGLQFEKNSGFDGLAEANGFLVVYPDGIEIGDGGGLLANGRVWNGGYCCGRAVTEGVDDVKFLSMLIDQLDKDYPVDTTRVYAAGHSNGAIMSYRLACELSDKIVAVGLQAGSLGVDTCPMKRPVSLLHIHGTADTNHPIDGGVGTSGISGVDFHPAIDGVETIARADGCESTPSSDVDTVNRDLTIDVYEGCRERSDVVFVRVRGASHAWMGHEGSRAAQLLTGAPYMDYDSSLAIWTFLASHARGA